MDDFEKALDDVSVSLNVKPNLFKRFVIYIIKRPKNISLLFILIIPLKLFLHFFLYREFVISGLFNGMGNKKIPSKVYQDFRYYLDHIFDLATNLFLPSFLTLLFISWYFNDKIKAR